MESANNKGAGQEYILFFCLNPDLRVRDEDT
jgi:hypothetical protein